MRCPAPGQPRSRSRSTPRSGPLTVPTRRRSCARSRSRSTARGRIFDRGLPTCRVRGSSRRRSGGAADLRRGDRRQRPRRASGCTCPTSRPFDLHRPAARLQRRALRRQTAAACPGLRRRPPSAFVLTFKILQRPRGPSGTVIKTTGCPRTAQKWAFVTQFDMKSAPHIRLQGPATQLYQRRLPGAGGLPGRPLPVRPRHVRFRRRPVGQLNADPRLHGPLAHRRHAVSGASQTWAGVSLSPATSCPRTRRSPRWRRPRGREPPPHGPRCGAGRSGRSGRPARAPPRRRRGAARRSRPRA